MVLFSEGKVYCGPGACKGSGCCAINALQSAVTLAPGHAVAQNNLGVALKATGQIQDAIKAFKKATAADPEFVPETNAHVCVCARLSVCVGVVDMYVYV